MFAVRRFAARAIAAPSFNTTLRAQGQCSRPYSLLAIKPSQTTSLLSFQRRWASNEAAETRQEPEALGAEEASHQTGGLSANAAEAQQESNASSQGDSSSDFATGRFNTYNRKPDLRAVFVANLFYDVSEAKLREEFSKLGEIESLKIAYDRRGLSKGYGWINFVEESGAKEAVAMMHDTVFEGRQISVTHSTSTRPIIPPEKRVTAAELAERPKQPPSRTLFIGNMSYEMTDTDLNELFRPIKNVVDVRVAIDRRTGQPRGFAHADFVDVPSAEAAAEFLGEQTIYGRKLRIDYTRNAKVSDRLNYSAKEPTTEEA